MRRWRFFGAHPRYGHASMMSDANTKLWVMGGHNDVDFSAKCSALDVVRGVWADIDVGDAIAARACAASCVIDNQRGVMVQRPLCCASQP